MASGPVVEHFDILKDISPYPDLMAAQLATQPLSTVGPDANINAVVAAKGSRFIKFNKVIRPNAAIIFNVDNAYTVGASGARASQLWAANGAIQTFDGNLKTNVVYSELELEFIKGLRPVSYRFISGGNIVEEVEDGYEEVERQVTEITDSTEMIHELVEIDGVKKIRSFICH